MKEPDQHFYINHDSKCKNISHIIPALSFVGAGLSTALLLTSVVCNTILIIAIMRKKFLLKKYMFYKMILNIAVADLLIALISDSISISYHVKEGLGRKHSVIEVVIFHSSLLIINGVSIFTLALFAIDRIVLLLRPAMFQNGLKTYQCSLLLFSTWFISALLIIPYFYEGYIKYLTIFCFVTVTVTCVCLIFLTLIYNRLSYHESSKSASNKELNSDTSSKKSNDENNLSPPPTKGRIYGSISTNSDEESENSSVKEDDETAKQKQKKAETKGLLGRERSNNRVSMSQRVNITFFSILIIFIVTYLPSVVMTGYMNLCEQCDCKLIHSLRELTYLFLLSSALWRPLLFLTRLQVIKKEALAILGFS